jgi:hypothetical protein
MENHAFIMEVYYSMGWISSWISSSASIIIILKEYGFQVTTDKGARSHVIMEVCHHFNPHQVVQLLSSNPKKTMDCMVHLDL